MNPVMSRMKLWNLGWNVSQLFSRAMVLKTWNCDETGCFWRALPDKDLLKQTKVVKGPNYVLQLRTFFVNAQGESESSRCHLKI